MLTPPVTRPPFRADHVGSLLRPPVLKQSFRDKAAGKIDDARFVTIQDGAVREAVAAQENAGLKVVTDGEFRRASYWGRFVERCEGFEIRPAIMKFRDDHGHELDFTATYAARKITRSRDLALDEFVFLKSVAKACPKITLPAPSTMHFYRYTDFADRTVYKDAESFFADLAQVYREEIAALGAAGCRYIQLDEVAIALLCDDRIRDKVRADGESPDRLVDLYVNAINDAIAGAPAGMAIGIHMCRGNFKGHYLSQGGYDSVAERFFTNANATHFLLEYDSPRAGDFAPLRFMPKNKGVVLGLVSSKSATLEDRADLKRRIEEAGKLMDVARLGIGPQCGFASTVAGNPVTETDQSAKLKLCVDVARETWGTA